MTEFLVARGRVLAVHADGAITVESAMACPGCRCGRMLAAERTPRRLQLEGVDRCAVGTDIEIAAPATELLRMSVWVYGLPWVALLGGTLLGTLLRLGDAGAMAGAVVGLTAGVVTVRAVGRIVTLPRLEIRSAP